MSLFTNMSLSKSVEALIRSRIVRILLALALIVVGAWAFLPHVAYRIAPTAFVNSELISCHRTDGWAPFTRSPAQGRDH